MVQPQSIKNKMDYYLHQANFRTHSSPPDESKDVARITSYNVCYTKLLRIHPQKHHDVETVE